MLQNSTRECLIHFQCRSLTKRQARGNLLTISDSALRFRFFEKKIGCKTIKLTPNIDAEVYVQSLRVWRETGNDITDRLYNAIDNDKYPFTGTDMDYVIEFLICYQIMDEANKYIDSVGKGAKAPQKGK